MHPLCDMPGCEEDSNGSINAFKPPWTGGMYLNLCDTHWSAMVACLPKMLTEVGKNVTGGNVGEFGA